MKVFSASLYATLVRLVDCLASEIVELLLMILVVSFSKKVQNSFKSPQVLHHHKYTIHMHKFQNELPNSTKNSI